MAKTKIILELSVEEYKVVEKALDNYKGRIIHLTKQNESNFEAFSSLIKQEKVLDKLISELCINK